jgi:large subunit ribosomal protein L1
MATRTNWKELYQDLPENIATLLRDARVKPEQLKLKSDGDILSIKGISESDLETIKSKFPADSADVADSHVRRGVPPVIADAVGTPTKPKKNINSPFYTYPRQVLGRSARYLSMAKKVKKIDQQPIEAAIKTIQSLSKRPGSLDLHLNVESTGLRGEAKLPFSTGKTIRVEIFSHKTITALNDGRMDYDVLLASPADMAKLAKFAKILGPKGLMPSPKNGTISPDPEARAKQLMAGSTLSFKTEPKAPIIHTTVGKTSQKTE